MKRKRKPVTDPITSYFHVVSIVPGFIAIAAYELLIFGLNHFRGEEEQYNHLDGLGILIPMILLMELFTFFLSRGIRKKISRLTNGIREVGRGDYQVHLPEKKAGALIEVYEDFNKMAKELESVDTLRNDFINDFSHEFKTPIVSIKGFADLLLEEEVDEEDQRQYLEIIAKESERLQRLTEETLMMSRLQKQQILTNLETYQLDEQLRRVAILLQNFWEKKEIELDLDLKPCLYRGHENLMMQVWINLLNNAIKFTPKGGRICLSLRELEDYLEVLVEDNGIGMTQEEVAHVFQKYYQGDRSRSAKGLGLGLSIAKRIVELSDGEISLTSKLGQGTCFCVKLRR